MAYNYLNYILDYFYGLPIWLGIVIGCAFCFFIIQMVYYWGFFTNIFKFKLEDFTLEGYKSHPSLKAPIAV